MSSEDFSNGGAVISHHMSSTSSSQEVNTIFGRDSNETGIRDTKYDSRSNSCVRQFQVRGWSIPCFTFPPEMGRDLRPTLLNILLIVLVYAALMYFSIYIEMYLYTLANALNLAFALFVAFVMLGPKCC